MDFSNTDIRGVDFSGAQLIDANFSYSIAGLSHSWIRKISVWIFFLSAVSGFTIAYCGGLIAILPFFSSLFILVFLASFIGLTLFRGLGIALCSSAIVMFVITAVVAALAWGEQFSIAPIIGAFAISGTVAGFVILAGGVALFRVMFHDKSISWLICIILIGTLLGSLFSAPPTLQAWAITGVVVSINVPLGIYIGLQSIRSNRKYELIRMFAIAVAAIGGTSFQEANLTDANFTGASLQNVDFRKANLKLVRWFNVVGLRYARTENTYLEDNSVLDLVVSGNGHGKSYNAKSLRGLNLKNANLVEAELIGADISEATLQNADLSGAKLMNTQLYGTDLTQATLTGTYIQDWAISVDTNFDRVKCKYVFMRLPTKNNPYACRKPDNEEEIFQESDFADFISPIIKTLSLYRQQNVDLRTVAHNYNTVDLFHYEGIDPSAAAVALQRLAKRHPEASIEVVSLESRGNQKVRLQTAVSNEVNPSDLSAQYSKEYEQLKALTYDDLQKLLTGFAQRDQEVMQQIAETIQSAIQQPKVYMEIGELIMSQSKGNINISDIKGNVSGVAAAGETQNITGSALGDISGQITNSINQLSSSKEPDEPGLKELLTQLQVAIEIEEELSEEDKIEALEQVKALADAAEKPEDGKLKKAAKTAIKILKGTTVGLSETTKLVQECSKLLPTIATLLAIV